MEEKEKGNVVSYSLLDKPSPTGQLQRLSVSIPRKPNTPQKASSVLPLPGITTQLSPKGPKDDEDVQFLFQRLQETPVSTPSCKRKISSQIVKVSEEKNPSTPQFSTNNFTPESRPKSVPHIIPNTPKLQGLKDNAAATLSPKTPATPSKPQIAPSTPTAKISRTSSTASPKGTIPHPGTPTTPTPKRRKHQWSKKTYLDMAETLQASFSFGDFAAKHGLERTEVYDAFSALILSPLLDQGTKGKDLVKNFRGEEKELIGRLKDISNSIGKDERTVKKRKSDDEKAMKTKNEAVDGKCGTLVKNDVVMKDG